MIFAITGIKKAGLSGGIRGIELVCFDTEDDARAEAENWLQKGYEDLAVWQQIGVPKLQTSVTWEGSHG